MTSTALGHPLVRSYLDELDAAFAELPPERALELREQISVHLEDALRPEAGDPEVAEVLRRLGPPAQLAAEAAAQAGSAELAMPPVRVMPPGLAPWRRRFSVRRLRWRGWTVIAVVVALIAGAGYLIAVYIALESAQTLQGPGAAGWWYPQDRAHEVEIDELTGEIVSAVPGRWGQQQGFVVTVTNPSDWTQTILGPVPYMPTPGGDFGVQLTMSGDDPFKPGGASFPSGLVFISLPGSIPPHQTRSLRVLWRTTTCQQQGIRAIINALELRVRVGWVTRTEVVPLSPYFTLNGTSPQRYCAGIASP